MGSRPLGAAAETAVNGYLTALLPPGEIADARHDVIADVRYWGDDRLGPVLRIAHGVVTQRLRVTDEAAAQVLADEMGLDDATIATVLDRTPEQVADLRRQVAAALAQTPADAPSAVTDPASDDAPSADEPVLRIGFDEDEPLPAELLEGAGRRWTPGRILVAAVAVWVVVAIALFAMQQG